MAQLVKHLTTLAQVMISQFKSSSPTSGSALTAQSLEPASDSVAPSLPAPLAVCACTLSLSFSKLNKHFKNILKKEKKKSIKKNVQLPLAFMVSDENFFFLMF